MKIINKKELALIIFLTILGLIIRLDFAGKLSGSSLLIGDSQSYNSIAENLLQGKGFLNTVGEVPVLPPLYPLFLAFLYFISGHNFFLVQLIQILLNLTTVFLAYLIVREHFKNKVFSYLFYLFGILYPFFIYWSRYLLSDINFAFLNILLFYLISKKDFNDKFYIIGLVFGLAVLQRGVILFLPGVIFFYYWIKNNLKTAVKFLCISYTIIFCFIVIWGMYNYKTHNKFVPIASYGGLSLYMGNNPYACPKRIYYSSNNCYDPVFINSILDKPFFKQNELCQKEAVQYIINHPFVFIKNMLIKIKVYWHEQRHSKLMSWSFLTWLNPILKLLDSIILYTGILGMILCLKYFKKYLLFYITIIYYTLISSVFIITEFARFRLPIMLFMIFFSIKTFELIYKSIIRLKSD